MQRSDSKDHYMQLKLGDVLRIEIKNHDVLLRVKEIIFEKICGNGLVPVSPDINFYNCFSETAVKIIMLNLS